MRGAAVLFGLGHFYKGPAGIVDSAYSGLVLGAVYLLAGRNLWAVILTHGISDTVRGRRGFHGLGKLRTPAGDFERPWPLGT